MRLTAFIAMVAACSLVASPGAAATLGPGAFVGARIHVPLGEQSASSPRAALAIAPTSSRVSADGMVRTHVGEGLAFNLAPREKATLTLAGVRADRALDREDKLGISTGGWIAIGVGTVLVAGAVGFALWVDSIEDNED